MDVLSLDTAELLGWLFESTFYISMLVCLILVLKAVTKGKLPAWWSYGLWLLLVVRMLLPWGVESPLSIFNLFPSPPGNEAYAPYLMEQVVSLPFIEESSRAISLEKILLLIWLAGVLVFSVTTLLKNLLFWAAIKRIPPVTDRVVLDVFDECRELLSARRKVQIIETQRVKSPALFGYIKPRLLLPDNFLDSLEKDELRCVFLHELGHLKSHDIAVSWLVAVLQTVHWFNPLVWYGFHHMRVDQEVACDAYVLTRIKQVDPADYANTIVGLLDRFIQNRQLPSLAGIIENKSQIKRRISLIMNLKKYTYKKTVSSVVMLLVVALVFFTSSSGLSSVNNDLRSNIVEHNSLYNTANNLKEVDQPPRVIRVPALKYPYEAVKEGISGKVVIRLVIGADGHPYEPEVVISEPEGVFDEAALDAASKYRFQPAKKNGKAVDCIVRLPMKFALDNGDDREPKNHSKSE